MVARDDQKIGDGSISTKVVLEHLIQTLYHLLPNEKPTMTLGSASLKLSARTPNRSGQRVSVASSPRAPPLPHPSSVFSLPPLGALGFLGWLWFPL